MKIRCKVTQRGQTLLVDLPDTPRATLADLLTALGTRLGVDSRDIALSLNGREPLIVADAASVAAEASPTLANLGLVSGDLVYANCPSSDAAAAAASAASAVTSRSPDHPTEEPPVQQPQPCQPPDHQASDSVAVPILVGEVGNTDQLCSSLQLLCTLYCPAGVNGGVRQFHRLMLALHCLMVETGFIAVDSATGQPYLPDNDDPVVAANRVLTKFLLPLSFSTAGGGSGGGTSVALHYRYRLAPEASALLKVVNAGRLAICHCLAYGPDAETILCASAHYSLDRFVASDGAASGVGGGHGYKELRHLSVHFKDSIAERAKAAIHESCGLPLLGLCGLPAELLLRIMRFCAGPTDVCRLGQACRRMHLLYADNYVWRALLVRAFSATSDRVAQYLRAERQGNEVNYCEAYRVFHEERTQRRRMLARLSSRELALPVYDVMPGVLPPIVLPPPGHPLSPGGLRRGIWPDGGHPDWPPMRRPRPGFGGPWQL